MVLPRMGGSRWGVGLLRQVMQVSGATDSICMAALAGAKCVGVESVGGGIGIIQPV